MPKPSLWAINALKESLPFFVRGNVVLMGDAAHAMTPHLGIGAGMSIEVRASLPFHLLPSNISDLSSLLGRRSAHILPQFTAHLTR